MQSVRPFNYINSKKAAKQAQTNKDDQLRSWSSYQLFKNK